MTPRRRHKLVGTILLLPFIAWSTTAVFFLVRPRYEQAYEKLEVRHLPLKTAPALQPQPDWEEVKLFESVLGSHLLVRTSSGWQHFDATTLQPWPEPDQQALIRLLEDSFVGNPERYGRIVSLDGNVATTTTGVTLTYDWDTLSLSQRGRDTYWINKVYDIHYLEWTGIKVIDKILGLSGLALLIYMTWSGMQLAFGWSLPSRTTRPARTTSPREA